MDVDGVISLFGFETPPPASVARFELVDGIPHCLSLAAGERLVRLSRRYELAWATGWEERANDVLPARLGVPELPVIAFGGPRHGPAHWKIAGIEAHLTKSGGERPMAWVDDSLDASCHEWAAARERAGAPTLLVPTDPELGLEEAHVAALEAWADSLAPPGPAAPPGPLGPSGATV